MAINWTKGENQGKTTHEGMVLEFPVYRPRAYSCDYEPFVAIIWNAEKKQTEEIIIGEVSYGSSWANAEVSVDATDEVRAFAAEYKTNCEKALQLSWEINGAWKKVTTINNVEMRVVAGRKIKKGTVVNALYSFKGPYGVCVKLSNGTLISADNVALCMSDNIRSVINWAKESGVTLARPEFPIWNESTQSTNEDWN